MEYLNTKILNYRLTRFIGEGGMAGVYEGTHEKLGTKVAIKILNPVLTANKQIRQRFENEAKMMASLDHPNITRVMDYNEQQDKLAIVMELLDGTNLASYIKTTGALTPEHAIPIFTQVLDAFIYAHGKSIIHRDIKPSNIFLDSENHVKILDFGIAKLLEAGDDFTSTGAQLGTPTYMSPEQVKAEKNIDHRTDIYSLGVTLYFLLNGKPPYDSSTQSNFEIFNKIVYEPIPDLKAFPTLNQIIQTAVAKDRNPRFVDAAAFKRALLNPDLFALPKPVIEKLKSSSEPEKPKTKETSEDDDKTWIDAPGVKPVINQSKQDKAIRNDIPEKQKEPEKKHKEFNFNERIKQADLLFNHNEFTRAKIAYENALVYRTDDEYIKARIERCKSELSWRKNRNIFIIATSVVIALLAIYLTIREFNKPKNNESLQISESVINYPLVYVPGGTFQMGSNDGEDDEKPIHTVTLDGFYIGKYEVTQEQWQELMGASPSHSNPSYFENCDNCPVEQVSWNDVQVFIKNLNKKTGKTYRLPTEAEWEYASRGGSESGVERSRNADFKYSGSNNIDEVAWHDGNSSDKTHPYGQKKQNALGIYDMSGNVWEWCSDWYSSDYYKNSSNYNPKGPSTGDYHVVRGGSWFIDPIHSRVANRNWGNPYDLSFDCGFRLAHD